MFLSRCIKMILRLVIAHCLKMDVRFKIGMIEIKQRRLPTYVVDLRSVFFFLFLFGIFLCLILATTFYIAENAEHI